MLAIEDRRFYPPGHRSDPRRRRALHQPVCGDRRYPVGGSTITQQLARKFFLSAEFNAELQTGQRSYRRKMLEAFMALILETKATKDEILELYLNDVYLGNRGSFALHGVAEAAKIFFGKDVSNLSLSEAALIAGIIQIPYQHSPFVNKDRAKERRDIVLRAMAEADFITRDAAESRGRRADRRWPRAPWTTRRRISSTISSDELETEVPGVLQRQGSLDVFTTLDLNLQRYAQEAVASGVAKVDQILAKRKVKPAPAQAALIAMDPHTGEVLALVGGRFYNQSQFNRAISARRQPARPSSRSSISPRSSGPRRRARTDLTPASMVSDEPTTWTYDEQEWSPRNYDSEYDGYITLRRALAMSRNIATIKVAEQTGFNNVAALWRRTKVGKTTLQGYPSIALGVFELTPLEDGDGVHRVCQWRRDQDPAWHRAHQER